MSSSSRFTRTTNAHPGVTTSTTIATVSCTLRSQAPRAGGERRRPPEQRAGREQAVNANELPVPRVDDALRHVAAAKGVTGTC